MGPSILILAGRRSNHADVNDVSPRTRQSPKPSSYWEMRGLVSPLFPGGGGFLTRSCAITENRRQSAAQMDGACVPAPVCNGCWWSRISVGLLFFFINKAPAVRQRHENSKWLTNDRTRNRIDATKSRRKAELTCMSSSLFITRAASRCLATSMCDDRRTLTCHIKRHAWAWLMTSCYRDVVMYRTTGYEAFYVYS